MNDLDEVMALHNGLTLRFISLLNKWRALWGEKEMPGRAFPASRNWRPAKWRNVP